MKSAPLMKGIRESTRASVTGRPPLSAASSFARPSSPLAASAASSTYGARVWRRIIRFASLSSTISTCAWYPRGASGTCSAGMPKGMVNENVLPRPGSLSTHMRPPIRSTSPRLMVRPSPVPPYLRVVEESA